MNKENLFGKTLEELAGIVSALGEKPFRAKQLFAWLYAKRVCDFAQMSNLAKGLRQKLVARYVVEQPTVLQKHVSSDGSIKYIFDMGPDQHVEAVFMPMQKGVTLCLSSQVGCAQACSFCMTAQMGFIRNLSVGEIVGQALVIAKDQEMQDPFNIVMMGMGEPLLNLRNLEKSLEIFTAQTGLDLSPKRITVSTSGHVRNLLKLGDGTILPRIAISLNASTDEQRNELMPVNLRWNIKQLVDACRTLPLKPRDRITFEYVMIRGINDDLADAKRLVRLLGGLRCKVNLIPFNETPQLTYRQPELAQIEAFHQHLNRHGILNTVRWSKGRDIGAACGQLATPVKKRGQDLRTTVHA